MNKIMLHIPLILIVNLLFCQFTPIEKLTKTAYYFYDEGDYSNAIISFEDLLAKQELIYDQNDMHIAKTLTRLGELYSFMDMPDISTYYFQEAIIILEKSYEKLATNQRCRHPTDPNIVIPPMVWRAFK